MRVNNHSNHDGSIAVGAKSQGRRENLTRITLDFDGSVISTKRYAEGVATGYNKKNKGERSYYPLYFAVGQIGQLFDVLLRSGNVHDSNGAYQFNLKTISKIRTFLPTFAVEDRMDRTYFSDELIWLLDRQGVELTVSVPFEQHTTLNYLLESCDSWFRVDSLYQTAEFYWKPKSWSQSFRIGGVKCKGLVQK